MRRTVYGFFGVLCILAVVGCQVNPVIQGGTSVQNQFQMELVGPGEKLVESGQISDARQIQRPDGVALDVWTIQGKMPDDSPPAGTVVLLHGLGESKADYLTIAKNLSHMGYDAVLIDLRAHGRSGGEYITCGAKEKYDVKAVVDALQADGLIRGKPVYVFGKTYGAATAIQYAAIDPRVEGVMAFTPWRDTVAKARRDIGPLASEEELAAKLDEAGQLADFDPHAASAEEAAAKLTCPVYLIHGTIDLAVPMADSQAIYTRIKGPRKLEAITPGLGQIIYAVGWDQWVPQQIDKLAKGTLDGMEPPPAETRTPVKPASGESEDANQPASVPTEGE